MPGQQVKREVEPPARIVENIERAAERRDLEATAVRPTQPHQTVNGDHEQEYMVEARAPDGTECVAVYRCWDVPGDWVVEHLRTEPV